MSLAEKLDIHQYLYIVLVLMYCGGLKGLEDSAMAD